MPWHLGFLVGLAVVAPPLPLRTVGHLEPLFARWEGARRDLRSLVVEFDRVEFDATFQQRRRLEGTFQFLRTPQGKVFASYEVRNPKGEKQERFKGLLIGETLYMLNDSKKVVQKLTPNQEMLSFLATYFNPFALLLDKKQALEQYQLEIVKEDEWYAYLAVKRNPAKQHWVWQSSWFGWSYWAQTSLSFDFEGGRVVFLKKQTEKVPKDVPAQLWWRNPNDTEITFEIRSWQMNGQNALKPEDFENPEKLSGWQILDRGKPAPVMTKEE